MRKLLWLLILVGILIGLVAIGAAGPLVGVNEKVRSITATLNELEEYISDRDWERAQVAIRTVRLKLTESEGLLKLLNGSAPIERVMRNLGRVEGAIRARSADSARQELMELIEAWLQAITL